MEDEKLTIVHHGGKVAILFRRLEADQVHAPLPLINFGQPYFVIASQRQSHQSCHQMSETFAVTTCRNSLHWTNPSPQTCSTVLASWDKLFWVWATKYLSIMVENIHRNVKLVVKRWHGTSSSRQGVVSLKTSPTFHYLRTFYHLRSFYHLRK